MNFHELSCADKGTIRYIRDIVRDKKLCELAAIRKGTGTDNYAALAVICGRCSQRAELFTLVAHACYVCTACSLFKNKIFFVFVIFHGIVRLVGLYRLIRLCNINLDTAKHIGKVEREPACMQNNARFVHMKVAVVKICFIIYISVCTAE